MCGNQRRAVAPSMNKQIIHRSANLETCARAHSIYELPGTLLISPIREFTGNNWACIRPVCKFRNSSTGLPTACRRSSRLSPITLAPHDSVCSVCGECEIKRLHLLIPDLCTEFELIGND